MEVRITNSIHKSACIFENPEGLYMRMSNPCHSPKSPSRGYNHVYILESLRRSKFGILKHCSYDDGPQSLGEDKKLPPELYSLPGEQSCS